MPLLKNSELERIAREIRYTDEIRNSIVTQGIVTNETIKAAVLAHCGRKIVSQRSLAMIESFLIEG